MRRPVHFHVGIGREQLAGGAIEHVEESVLRRLHDHLALPAGPVQVRQHHRLHRRVVPGIGRRRLVMPHQLAVVGIDGEDRAQVQVVAAAGAAQVAVPRRAVAGADVKQIQLRVVDDRIPHRAAAADLEPLGAVPRRQRFLERLVLLRLRRIAGHRIETPRELPGFSVVGRHVSAHAVLRTAVADDHLALGDARRARDREGLCLIDGGGLPGDFSAVGVERHEPAIEHADNHLAFVEGGAAIDHVAARKVVVLAVHLGVVPSRAACRCARRSRR